MQLFQTTLGFSPARSISPKYNRPLNFMNSRKKRPIDWPIHFPFFLSRRLDCTSPPVALSSHFGANKHTSMTTTLVLARAHSIPCLSYCCTVQCIVETAREERECIEKERWDKKRQEDYVRLHRERAVQRKEKTGFKDYEKKYRTKSWKKCVCGCFSAVTGDENIITDAFGGRPERKRQ